MTPTVENIPTTWMSHGYAPRDLLPTLRLVSNGDSVALNLSRTQRYMTAVSAALSVGMLAWWYIGSWGNQANDIQMKWIVFGAGLIFCVLAGSYAMASRRYGQSGQRFEIDTTQGIVQIASPTQELQLPLAKVIGTQILQSTRGAQLNLVYDLDSDIERVWIHTDAPVNIGWLAQHFSDSLDINVVSEFNIRGKPAITNGNLTSQFGE